MDNFHIDITAESDATLTAAIGIAFGHNCPGSRCGHYKVAKLKRKVPNDTQLYEDPTGFPALILLWNEEQGSTRHPFAMDLTETVGFVKGWLRNCDFGAEPGHDGDNGRGFRLFTEGWGHVAGHTYAICAVAPAWAMYGK